MGVCKEKRKRKRAVKALEKACEYLMNYEYCPYATHNFNQEIIKEFGCLECEDATEEPLKCWKKYFYLEVDANNNEPVR